MMALKARATLRASSFEIWHEAAILTLPARHAAWQIHLPCYEAVGRCQKKKVLQFVPAYLKLFTSLYGAENTGVSILKPMPFHSPVCRPASSRYLPHVLHACSSSCTLEQSRSSVLTIVVLASFFVLQQVVIFNRGRIEQQGTPNDIIKKPRTPFIMKFVGDTNIVPATSQVGDCGAKKGGSCCRVPCIYLWGQWVA